MGSTPNIPDTLRLPGMMYSPGSYTHSYAPRPDYRFGGFFDPQASPAIPVAVMNNNRLEVVREYPLPGFGGVNGLGSFAPNAPSRSDEAQRIASILSRLDANSPREEIALWARLAGAVNQITGGIDSEQYAEQTTKSQATSTELPVLESLRGVSIKTAAVLDTSSFMEKLEPGLEVLDVCDSHGFMLDERRTALRELLLRPPQAHVPVLQRQAAIRKLAEHKDLDRLIELRDAALLLPAAISTMRFNPDETTPLYQLYMEGDKELGYYEQEWMFRDRNQAPDARYAIAESIQHAHAVATEGARYARILTSAMAELFGDEESPTGFDTQNLEIYIDALKDYMPLEEQHTVMALLGDIPKKAKKNEQEEDLCETASRNSQNIINGIRHGVLELGAMLDVARIVRDQGWTEVTFDSNRPSAYRGAWNYSIPKSHQKKIDSPNGEPIVFLSGPNTSGKSATIATDVRLWLAAHATGFAPAEQMNIQQPTGQLAVIDRGSGDAEFGLSAFQAEVRNWVELLRQPGTNSRWLMDEAFSTTSPEDQADLQLAVAEYLHMLGGTALIATHNDEVLDRVEGKSPSSIGVYSLACSLLPDGSFERHFIIEPVRRDSMSLDIAHNRGFSPTMIEDAAAYLRGETREPRLGGSSFPEVVLRPESERRELKKQSGLLNDLFDVSSGQLLQLITKDHDFIRFFDAEHGAFKTLEAATQERSPRWQIEVMRSLDPVYLSPIIARMLRYGAAPSPSDLAERQLMFAELVRDDLSKHIYTNGVSALSLTVSYDVLTQGAELGFREALFPFRDEKLEEMGFQAWFDARYDDDNARSRLSDDLERSIAYLEICEIVHGTSFGMSELLSEFRKQYAHLSDESYKPKRPRPVSHEDAQYLFEYERTLHEMHERRLDNQYVDEVSKQAGKSLIRQLILEHVGFKPLNLQDLLSADISDQLKVFASVGGDEALYVNPLSGHLEYLQAAKGIITGLRATDSVYLRQAANSMQALIDAKQKKLDDAILHEQGKSIKANGVPHEVAELEYKSMRFVKRDRTAEVVSEGDYKTLMLRLAALSVVANAFEQDGYSPVTFNTTGDFELRDCFASFQPKQKSVPNDIILGSVGATPVLTGPNGSGKTYYEKSAVVAAAIAMATGYAPASSANIPYIGKIIYLDRVTDKVDPELSSFAQEIAIWNELYAAIDGNPALVVADELFSTTSPRYQAALTYATMLQLQEAGHFALLATHNHDVVDRARGLAEPYHFGFSVGGGGKISYDFRIQPGHATSYALEVATTLGMPHQIIDAVKRAREKRAINSLDHA